MATCHLLADTSGTGPFPAAKSADAAFAGHVAYRPADLGRLGGRKLPIVLWANGGCTDDGAAERLFLEEIASCGYLVLAPGAILSGPGAAPAPPAPPAPPPPQPSQKRVVRMTTAQVEQGLEQALAANRAPGPWHDRLDESRVARSPATAAGASGRWRSPTIGG